MVWADNVGRDENWFLALGSSGVADFFKIIGGGTR